MLELKEEKKKEIYAFVKDLFRKYYDKRDNYDNRVFDWVRLYNSIPETTRNGLPIQDWQHNTFVAYIFANVKTIKPRVKASLFNDPKYVTIEAIDQNFIDHQDSITAWYLFKLNGMKFKKKASQWIHDALIYPCGWAKVLTKEDKNEKKYIDVQRVDYLDIWVDFAYRDKIRDVFHRIESNTNKLKALEEKGVYENVDQLIGEGGDKVPYYPTDVPETKSMFESLYMSISDQGIDKTKEKAEARKLNKVELLEWWGSYDVEGKGYDKKIVVTIANREVGLRIDEYEDDVPFFPIRISKNTRVIYGKPIPQQLEMLQEELNEQRSKRYDILDRLLQLMFKARRTASIDWDTLFSAPDNVLLMDDIETDLAIIDQRPLPAAAYQEESITKSDMEFVSGARDFGAIGAEGTATGINAILSESATMFRDTVDDIVEDLLDLMDYIFLKIKKHSTTVKDTVKLFDSEEWVTITENELKGDYRINLGISSITTANKEMRLQLFINLLNVVGKLQGMVNIKEFIRMILAQADIKNIDKILQETKGDKQKQLIAARDDIAQRKEEGLKTGMAGVTDRITGQPIIEPVTPTAQQGIQSPLMSLFAGMQGQTQAA